MTIAEPELAMAMAMAMRLDRKPSLQERIACFLSWAAPEGSDSPGHFRIREIVPQLIRAAVLEEREACARLADAEVPKWNDTHERCCRDIAAAIRSRP